MFAQKLPKPWNAYYLAGRLILWCVFVVGIFIFAVPILFPSSTFVFDFKNAKSASNTLMDPRTTGGNLRGNGRVSMGETFHVDASAPGDFSDAVIHLSENALNGTAGLEKGVFSVRRSQKAFFYPEGSPAAFPEGSLLRYGNEYYHIAPDRTRKRFPTEDSVQSLGFDPTSFFSISSEELLVNRDGGTLDLSNDNPPNGSFIHSDDTYYEWRDKKLIPFVSKESFLARFPESWALPEDASFVHEHEISETWLGYPSGSLLAWSDGVFLMDGNVPRPILGVDVFLSLGFSWDDVRPASDEEISFSQKGKAIGFGASQPDGTVFLDTKEQRYFLIEDGEKHEIRGENLIRLWLGNQRPLVVSSDSLTKESSCVLEKTSSFFSSSLTCTVPLGDLAGLPGDTYEFSLLAPNETDIQHMDISLERSAKQKTFLETLSNIKKRVLSRYDTPTP